MSEPARILPRPPEGWLRSAFAGVEAAVLSWLIPALAGLVAYVTTASSPGLGQATWNSAVGVASGWWFTSFGGEITLAEGGVYRLIPLGMTIVTALLVRGSMRRAGANTPALAAFAGVAFVLAVSMFGTMLPNRSWLSVAGPLVLVLVVALTMIPLPVARIPVWVRAAIRLGVQVVGVALLAGLITVGIAIGLGWDDVRTIHASLQPDAVSSVVFVLLQLAYLPNAAMMALGYLSGPGFAVGTGTHYTVFTSVTEPLPAIPVLGALPDPGAGPGWPMLLVLVGVGFVVGLLRAWRSGDRRPAAIGMEIAIALPVHYVLLAGSSRLASGSLGPGRMAEVGTNAPIVALAATGLLGAGLAAGLFARLGLKAAALVDTGEAPAYDPDDDAFFSPAPALRVLEAESVADGGSSSPARSAPSPEPPTAATPDVSAPSPGTPSD